VKRRTFTLIDFRLVENAELNRIALSGFFLANHLFGRRAEPDFVKSIGLRKRSAFQGVVTGQDPVFIPLGGALSFGRTREGIIGQHFGVGVKFADRTVSSVRQNEFGHCERNAFRVGAEPERDNSEIARRDASLVGAGPHIGHYAVQIQKVVPLPRMEFETA
jgi:hypothetical protein